MKFFPEMTQRILGIKLLSEIFVCGKLHKGIHLLNSYFSLCQRHLHELDGGTVGISDVDNALACVRTGFERLRFAGCSPTGCDNFFKDGVEIIYDERDMEIGRASCRERV